MVALEMHVTCGLKYSEIIRYNYFQNVYYLYGCIIQHVPVFRFLEEQSHGIRSFGQKKKKIFNTFI